MPRRRRGRIWVLVGVSLCVLGVASVLLARDFAVVFILAYFLLPLGPVLIFVGGVLAGIDALAQANQPSPDEAEDD